ncbi:hypothetical protein [Pontiella sp.]|uniref:hypothetical protein n=1 Tax=Pontiella sp. TaxID=2837462 RepID=UPI00356432EE
MMLIVGFRAAGTANAGSIRRAGPASRGHAVSGANFSGDHRAKTGCIVFNIVKSRHSVSAMRISERRRSRCIAGKWPISAEIGKIEHNRKQGMLHALFYHA